MENMAILNTTALDFVEDYNRVDIWNKRLCSVGWFMFEAVLLKNNDSFTSKLFTFYTLRSSEDCKWRYSPKIGMPLFFRLACWTGPEHFASTPLCYQHEGRSTLRLAPNRLNQATVTISLQSLPLSKAHFPADYRSDSLDCLRRSKLCSGYWSQALITEE